MTPADTADVQALLRQRESLREVIESISSELELQPLLTLILRHACALLGADRGTIGLVDEARGAVRTVAAYRMPPDEVGAETPPGVGLAGHVLRTRQPVILNRYGDIERPTQLGMLEDAVIGVPIVWRGRMTGVFGLGSPPPRRFTEEDVEVLSLFAKHAAIAIENARLFARRQGALEEVQLLYETSRRIATAMDIDEVVAAYLEQVAARGRYACSVALYECDAAEQRAAVVVHGQWTPDGGMALGRRRFPYTRDDLDPLLDAGRTAKIADVHTDPRVSDELRRIQARDQRPALAMIPLIARGQRIGLVCLSDARVHDWLDADLQLYQATAAQLAIAIDSRRQHCLLYERGRQLAVLEERQWLARELHDSVTQTLFSTTLIAQSIGPAWRRDPEEGERRVQRLLELSQSALAEMRTLLAELRPAEPRPVGDAAEPAGLERVRQWGLEAALRRHIAEVAPDGLEIRLDANGYTRQPAEQEGALYRIAQEALSNAVKHSRAQRVEIRLRTEDGETQLIVQDDGTGFADCGLHQAMPLNPRSAIRNPQSHGLGLTTMRERAETLGGRLRIVTAPGSGTTIAVTIPGKR